MKEFSSPAVLEDLEAARDVTALLDAAKAGDVDAVTGQLDGVGTPVDSCVLKYGRTALHWACEGGHEAVCQKLIDAFADVNFRDRSGATPLHWAAWNGHAAICTLLVENGADAAAQDNDDDTPLDGASDDACKAAIQAGMKAQNATQQDPDQQTNQSSVFGSPGTPIANNWKETSGRVNQTVKTLVDETVRLHDMVEQLVEQNGRLMHNQALLVAEVKRLRTMLGQPIQENVS